MESWVGEGVSERGRQLEETGNNIKCTTDIFHAKIPDQSCAFKNCNTCTMIPLYLNHSECIVIQFKQKIAE